MLNTDDKKEPQLYNDSDNEQPSNENAHESIGSSSTDSPSPAGANINLKGVDREVPPSLNSELSPLSGAEELAIEEPSENDNLLDSTISGGSKDDKLENLTQTPKQPIKKSSSIDTPHPDVGYLKNNRQLEHNDSTSQASETQSKSTTQPSSSWMSKTLNMVMFFASFGAGFNFMINYMNGKFNSAHPHQNADFQIYGQVTNLAVLGATVAVKTSLDLMSRSNVVTSVWNSSKTCLGGFAFGLTSGFGFEKMCNAEQKKTFLTQVKDIADKVFNNGYNMACDLGAKVGYPCR